MELFFLILCLITILFFLIGVIGCVADPNSAKKWPERMMGAAAITLSFAITILLFKIIIVSLMA